MSVRIEDEAAYRPSAEELQSFRHRAAQLRSNSQRLIRKSIQQVDESLLLLDSLRPTGSHSPLGGSLRPGRGVEDPNKIEEQARTDRFAEAKPG